MRSICSLGCHDQSVSEADVLLNLTLFSPHHTVTVGSVLQLTAVPSGYSVTYGSEQDLPVEPKRGYHFVAQEADNEVLSKIAGIQVIHRFTSKVLGCQHTDAWIDLPFITHCTSLQLEKG